MSVVLDVRSESAVKSVYRRDALRRIAERIVREEGVRGDVELSLLFCDDPAMRALNSRYRNVDESTDVLSFPQEDSTTALRVLGDVVISLETVARRCGNDAAAMRAEAKLLFCHGLLHLLGYDHRTPAERGEMAAKQARYLNIPLEAAWRSASGGGSTLGARTSRGGVAHLGR